MSGSGWIGALQQLIAGAGPGYLGGSNIGRLVQSLGLTLTQEIEELGQGLRMAQPYRCDPSALPYLARDRGIYTFATEPEDLQRWRLAHFWQAGRQRGTHQGELRAVLPFFAGWATLLPKLKIVHQHPGGDATWHTLDASAIAGTATGAEIDAAPYTWTRTAGNWDWDGVPTAWSRFWLIIHIDGLGLPAQPEWDGGQLWDDGEIWDGVFTYDQITDLVAAINMVKSAHSALWGIILATDPASFDPTASPTTDPDGWTSLPAGQWYSTIDPVTGKPTRLPSCAVVYNRGKA